MEKLFLQGEVLVASFVNFMSHEIRISIQLHID